MTQRFTFGLGAVSELAHWLPPTGETVLLMTGSRSYAASGAAEAIGPLLSRHSVRHFRVTSVNPRLEEVAEAASSVGEPRPQLVLAVGGGSVIDTAKLVALALGSGVDPQEMIVSDTSGLAALDLVAVPTTAGSGAERTHFAVVYSAGIKYSVAADVMRPMAALVDPTLTHSLTPTQTAASGFDAFAHAMESMWSIHATPESQAISAEALGLVWDNLGRAVAEPSPDVRRQLALGASMAGAAIDITRTTAPHALSYHLTTEYGLAHGHAVALTLGSFLEFNGGVTDADVVDPRGASHVRSALESICSVLEVSDPSEGRELVGRFTRDLRLTMPEALAPPGARQVWGRSANLERLSNNPRRVDNEALSGLLAGL